MYYDRATYVRLRGRQMELNEGDLRVLDGRWATGGMHGLLIEAEAVDQLHSYWQRQTKTKPHM